MRDDPLLSLLDERIAELAAAVPQDLTKIAAGDPPLGLERLVTQALEGGANDVDNADAPRTRSIRRVRLSSLVGKPNP
jgi:hypothetical protein